MFAVDQNIPIAPKKSSPRPNAKCWRYPFDRMEVGDSFFLPPRKDGVLPNVNAAAKQWGDKRGRKFSVRSVDGGVRVWRVK